MKILITGATGKVGSRLSKHFSQRGEHVRALVRDRERAVALLGAHIEYAQGDLLDASTLASAVRGVDAVVHCAAFFRGASADQAHAVNNLGTQRLAQAAREARVGRFVFTSTGLVYGPKNVAAKEDDTCEPTLPYPISKLAAERFLLALADLDVRVLRLPFVYGGGDPHIEEALPMMRGLPATLRMSVAHHADVAQAVARVLDANTLAHRIYNVVDDEPVDLTTVFASVGAPPPDGTQPQLAAVFGTLFDGKRLREELGFQPTYPRLRDAVQAGQHR